MAADDDESTIDDRTESTGAGVEVDPIDMGETDAVEATDEYDWS